MKKEIKTESVLGCELGKLGVFFSACKDHSWNVANKIAKKIYHLGMDSLDMVLYDTIEGRDCNILYMLPHIYKPTWKTLKKLPYMEDLARRTDLKAKRDEIITALGNTNFVYRDQVATVGPVKLTDKKSGRNIQLLFVQLPYVYDDMNDIISARKLYRATQDAAKAMNWTNYTDVFKHYILSTGFSAGQSVRAYLVTVALAAAVKHGLLELVIPSSEYMWDMLERDITNNQTKKSIDMVASAWKNAIDYSVASCDDINKGLMDIHIVDLDDVSDCASMFNYDVDSVYPAPTHFSFTKVKRGSSKTLTDEPKKTEALDDVAVTVNTDTLDEVIEKAAEKENLD